MSDPELDRSNDPAPRKNIFQRNKHLTLWLSVGCTMIFVVIMWLLILPSQLGGSGFGLTDAARWQVVKPQVQKAGTSFEETLNRIGQDLDNKIQQSQMEAQAIQAAVTAVNAQTLTQKLEAAVNANGSQGTAETNEDKK